MLANLWKGLWVGTVSLEYPCLTSLVKLYSTRNKIIIFLCNSSTWEAEACTSCLSYVLKSWTEIYCGWEAEDKAQQLRALCDLPSSRPSWWHGSSQASVTLVLGDKTFFCFWPPEAPGKHVHIGKMLRHIKINKCAF